MIKITFLLKEFKLINNQAVLFVLALLYSVTLFSQDMTYNIDDPEKLEDQTYLPGDVIILANNTYSSDARIDFVGNGTADKPITFRAETPGGVIFDNGLQMNIGGDYVVVDGFHWQGGYGASNFIQFRNGTDYANHSTIQNCAIDGLGIHPDDVADDIADNSITKHRWIVLYGTYNTVINCSFMNKVSAGALILAEYQYNAEDNRCTTVGHTISNNYFYKYAKMDPSLSNSGDSETIRIGTSEYQNVNSNVTVSNNYFVEADGENEIITNKSKGNIYTNNTFRKCRGSLVLRHGSDATVDGNYFLGHNVDGTGGIRITDSNHTITNNYIQDCITVVDQAKWNNGITFIGGGSSAAVVCSSTSTSNGYQKSENINVSNNTIINTNAPLYYNEDKGSTDPTGTVSNNLIYFEDNSAPRHSDVISGDSASAFDNLGTSLTYSGNVYTGTMLGATTTGFSEENAITATPDGEIFTFSGTSSAGKGADMGAYAPTTDEMVGYGIGACFIDHDGDSILDGDCTIEVIESLTVSSLSPLVPEAGSYDVTVNANVGWSAVSNDGWISIDVTSGTGNATVSVTVTENATTTERVGTVTFTQDPGGDGIVRILTVTQEGADLTSLYDLINDVSGGGPVSIHSWSTEFNPGKPEENVYKTLDKVNSNSSIWAAEDGALVGGDYKGDGEYIIYDLGADYDLDLIQFSTTDKSDPFGYQVWMSTTGTDPGDFTMILPTTGALLLTTKTGTNDFNQYEITETARYVKMIGFGRFNSAGDTRTSAWSTIAEIEFFGTQNGLSTTDIDLDSVSIFPVPSKNILNIKTSGVGISKVHVYSLDGRHVLNKVESTPKSETSLDISSLSNGTYLINFSNENGLSASKMIIVSH
ncbi:chondroitinase-B domain-containing protein [Seonamhaeicola maritimus]|uniref:T9SS type A sorting domain-containing protein n=1 Tax=Seonamhaeicola maritimus TaxID=2591822 RepID=A0A5C7GKS8_9FLAO|nr:chondroitinase-B domain-containing protein [Seonamhaeicola maritimus]TXG38601.1 T9SS type A sorting domain-containing protein [Seonamhaeicola maritimus]